MEKWVPRWNDPICDAVTAVRNMLGTNAVTYPVWGVSFLDENTKVVVFGLSRLVCAWVVEVPGGVGAFVETVVFAFAKSAEGRNEQNRSRISPTPDVCVRSDLRCVRRGSRPVNRGPLSARVNHRTFAFVGPASFENALFRLNGLSFGRRRFRQGRSAECDRDRNRSDFVQSSAKYDRFATDSDG
ncbi:hypothetical protein MTP99_019031 [Tenebrio molitor]|nr:hypothetical protein MTP99_019031 [Tenebrio molitor]